MSELDVRMNMGSIRSAVSIYYGDMEGVYPANLRVLTVGSKYIERIPRVWDNDGHGDNIFPARKPQVPHPISRDVEHKSDTISRDSGKWGYINNPADANVGVLFVDCTHTDSKRNVWTTY